MTQWEEWRRVDGLQDVFVNLDGDVEQDDHILVPFTKPGYGTHRWVTVWIDRHKWDYENRQFIAGEEDVLVWQLMKETWFTNWSLQDELFFVDGDKFNCSAENIRQWSVTNNRMVHVREDEYSYAFDRRIFGQIEIVELNRVVNGIGEAAKTVNGTKSGVSKVLSGALERHKGFHFRWV